VTCAHLNPVDPWAVRHRFRIVRILREHGKNTSDCVCMSFHRASASLCFPICPRLHTHKHTASDYDTGVRPPYTPPPKLTRSAAIDRLVSSIRSSDGKLKSTLKALKRWAMLTLPFEPTDVSGSEKLWGILARHATPVNLRLQSVPIADLALSTPSDALVHHHPVSSVPVCIASVFSIATHYLNSLPSHRLACARLLPGSCQVLAQITSWAHDYRWPVPS
jgi:hypothetical protein